MKTTLKLVVRPRMIPWHEAKELARLNGGRLLNYSEVMKWANNEPLELDIWIDRMEHDRAQYFDALKQDVRFKPPEMKCLLVMLVDPAEQRKMLEQQQSAAQKRERKYKLLKRQRLYRSSQFKPIG